jgi:hypothetical protein
MNLCRSKPFPMKKSSSPKLDFGSAKVWNFNAFLFLKFDNGRGTQYHYKNIPQQSTALFLEQYSKVHPTVFYFQKLPGYLLH